MVSDVDSVGLPTTSTIASGTLVIALTYITSERSVSVPVIADVSNTRELLRQFQNALLPPWYRASV